MWRKIGGTFMALLGVGSLCFCFYWLGQEVLLDVTGRAVTGVVAEKSTSSDENDNVSYYLSYSYADSDGHSYTGKSDVFKSMYEDHAQGSPIPVVYSSSYPTVSRIRSAGEGLLPAGMFALIGGGAIWLGLRMLLRQIYWENKVARLMAKGERRLGRLLAVEEDKSEESEGESPLVLVYIFTDKTGQERTGKTFHIKGRDHAFWKGRIGCALEVRVNPNDPSDHIALVEESKVLG